MLDDTRLDAKLLELSRELTVRALVPGFAIADAFTLRGLDEAGRPGLFAAVLLGPGKVAELETLTAFRQILTQRLKQLDTRTPAWPIVVQAQPEHIDGSSSVPGGREYFNQVKHELIARTERMKQRVSVSQMPAVRLAPESRRGAPVITLSADSKPGVTLEGRGTKALAKAPAKAASAKAASAKAAPAKVKAPPARDRGEGKQVGAKKIGGKVSARRSAARR